MSDAKTCYLLGFLGTRGKFFTFTGLSPAGLAVSETGWSGT
ncbi:hypothetical protein [Mesorhizobium sp. AR07]|nr:hypothetical protein [Mesorhizobium sp. AR07]